MVLQIESIHTQPPQQEAQPPQQEAFDLSIVRSPSCLGGFEYIHANPPQQEAFSFA